MKKAAQITFLAVAAATILEYMLICGLFTGPLMMLLVCIVGLWNLVLAVRDKEYNAAGLYVICILALNMGYWRLMP